MVRILERGYLPRELPPPFTSSNFAAWIQAANGSLPKEFNFRTKGKGNKTTKFAIHNLARAGTLRRKLGIPNPVSYYQLASALSQNWRVLAKFSRKSPLSLSKPKYVNKTGLRAIIPRQHFQYLPRARARVRAGNRFVLQTDINNFYPSVYTHTIPWAIHGKPKAKLNKSNKLLGNLLDSIIRLGQDQQTVGIPIGPDTSLVIAELLLSAIDEILLKRLPRLQGYRYVDDYEFAFPSVALAEEALAALQSILAEFELQLNPRKTQIAELPSAVEALWVPEFRLYRIRFGARGQSTDLLDLFSKAFELCRAYREESIVKYAIARISSQVISRSNWDLYEDLLLQSAVTEPGTLDSVVVEIFRYMQAGYPICKDKVAAAFNAILTSHAPREHGSEVAWALWGHLIFRLPIDLTAAKLIGNMRDSIVALLLLHARAQNLVPTGVTFSQWNNLMKPDELYSENWLLAYEGLAKGWLPSFNGRDYVSTDPCFGPLKAAGVTFYNSNASQAYSALHTRAMGEAAVTGYGIASTA